MSETTDPGSAEQAGSCCAAIDELRKRAAQRAAAQHIQVDDSDDRAAEPPEPARVA